MLLGRTDISRTPINSPSFDALADREKRLSVARRDIDLPIENSDIALQVGLHDVTVQIAPGRSRIDQRRYERPPPCRNPDRLHHADRETFPLKMQPGLVFADRFDDIPAMRLEALLTSVDHSNVLRILPLDVQRSMRRSRASAAGHHRTSTTSMRQRSAARATRPSRANSRCPRRACTRSHCV